MTRPGLDIPVEAKGLEAPRPPIVVGGAYTKTFGAQLIGDCVEPPISASIILDPLQQRAIDDCGTRLFTNISGTAGVGKTLVAKEIIKTHAGTILAATTGIASCNLGEGTTINALLRYFDTRDLVTKYTNGHLQAILRKLHRAGTRRILIDEKSMLAGQQLTPIIRAVREVNEGDINALDDAYRALRDEGELPDDPRDLPPMGVTLVGDFGQLPPVPDSEEYFDEKAREKKLCKIPVQFAFESPEWPLFAEHTTTLTTIFRQDAQDFVRALHAVRRGDVATAMSFFTEDRFTPVQNDHFDGTTIFAKNDAVERYNLLKLDSLQTPAMSAKAIRLGKQRPDWKQVPDDLRLKEGALVMILANKRVYEDDDDDTGTLVYANGDLGVLRGVRGTAWVVTLKRTGADVLVTPVRRENTIPLEPGRRKELTAAGQRETHITDKGKGKQEIIGSVTYMPLRAAWAATVHKTQGLTLSDVQINIADGFWKQPHMLFVALSRCQTAEGLRLVGSPRGFVERVKIEPRTLPWL